MIYVRSYGSMFDPQRVRRDYAEPWCVGSTPRALMPRELRDAPDVRCWRNGVMVAEAELDQQCTDNDVLHYAALPAVDPVSVSLFGFELFQATGLAAAFFTVAAPLANLLVAQYAIRALVGSPDKPTALGDAEDSAYYGFGGIQSNKDVEGSALPVVYGEHRVAGVVLQSYTRVLPEPPTEYLFTLMMMAGHQVQRIGDKEADGGPYSVTGGDISPTMQVENQPISNFREVEAFVRLGTAAQQAIPDHENPTVQFNIERTLDPPEDPLVGEITPGTYTQGAAALDVWTTPVTYTAGDVADEALLDIHFPEGLFSLDSNAVRQNVSVEVQARYIRVDQQGERTGDWVVLPKFNAFTFRQGRPFTIEQVLPFLDPDAYAAPTVSQYLTSLNGSTGYAADTTVSGIPSMSAASTEITVLAWIRINWTRSGAGTSDNEYILGFSDQVIAQQKNTHGFTFRLTGLGTWTARETYNNNYWRYSRAQLEVDLHTGPETFTTEVTWTLPDLLLPSNAPAGTYPKKGKWALVGFTYQANAPNANGQNEIKFYANSGIQIGSTRTTSTDAQWDQAQSIYVGANAGASEFFNGDIEEVLFYQRALGAGEIASKFTSGVAQPSTSSEQGIVAGWHFDSTGADFVGSNDLTLNGSAAISVSQTDGPVATVSAASVLRDRYEVQLQRLTGYAANTVHQRDKCVFRSIKLRTYEPQNYAGLALLATRIQATDQVNTSSPLITDVVRGALCPVWDGASTVTPNTPEVWTRNPAWIMLHAARNRQHGLGQFFGRSEAIDWPAMLAAARYYDELVYDLGGRAQGIVVAKVGVTAGWPRGYVQVTVDTALADVPSGWPGEIPFASPVAEEDAEHWLAFDSSGASSPTAPSWVTGIDGYAMAIGAVVYSGANRYVNIYCHALFDQTETPWQPTVGSFDVERREPRMQFDGVFDRNTISAWEAMVLIAKSARSAPYLRGRQLTVFVDRKRDPSAMVSQGNVLPASLERKWSATSTRPNHVEIEFLDRDQLYEQRSEPMDHDEVNDPTTSVAIRPRLYRLEGVTRTGQVRRHAKQDLNTFHLSRNTSSFLVGPDALGFEPGDVFVLAHDLPLWGVSGRLFYDSPNRDELYLDREVTIAASTSYEVQVRDSRTGLLHTVAVDEATTGGTGTYGVGYKITLESDLEFLPQRGDLYVWGEVSKAGKKFVVVQTEFDTKRLQRTVLAAEYHDEMYDPEAFASYPASPSALPQPTLGSLPS